MTVGTSSTFTVGGSHDFQNSGLVQGTGTIQAGNLINTGTVHPGDSPGILTVAGNYSQMSSGHLDIQIGGAKPGAPVFLNWLSTGSRTLAERSTSA